MNVTCWYKHHTNEYYIFVQILHTQANLVRRHHETKTWRLRKTFKPNLKKPRQTVTFSMRIGLGEWREWQLGNLRQRHVYGYFLKEEFDKNANS